MGGSNKSDVQDVNLDNSAQSGPLGLKLRKSKSLLDLVDERLCKGKPAKFGDGERKLKINDFKSRDKVKAVNYPVEVIKIGSWQRVCRYGGDLVGKMYYAKHKMVWEILDGALKSKIEIQWSAITAIKATFNSNEKEVLEFELKDPPLFYQEIKPQPRKHTLWQQSTDFTGGQASLYRRHFAEFPPRSFRHHYEKLLQCDQRLYALSKKQFPNQECPFFQSVIYRNLQISPINFNEYQNIFAITRGPVFETPPNSTLPVMNWSRGNESGRDYQRATHNGNASFQLPIQRPLHMTSPAPIQGPYHMTSSTPIQGPLGITSLSPMQGPLHITSHGNEVSSSQDYQSNRIVLNNLDNHLLRHSQVASSEVELMMHSNPDPHQQQQYFNANRNGLPNYRY